MYLDRQVGVLLGRECNLQINNYQGKGRKIGQAYVYCDQEPLRIFFRGSFLQYHLLADHLVHDLIGHAVNGKAPWICSASLTTLSQVLVAKFCAMQTLRAIYDVFLGE